MEALLAEDPAAAADCEPDAVDAWGGMLVPGEPRRFTGDSGTTSREVPLAAEEDGADGTGC